MSVATQSTVVGTFETASQAQSAVSELRSMGFAESQIGVASKSSEEIVGAHTTTNAEENAGEGAATGAAVGLGAGALWGLGILAGVLPAIGPVIAGGTLAAIAASAATGAAAGGLAGALLGMGVSKEDVEYYNTEFTRGRTVVTVDAGDRAADASRALARNGATNRAGRW